MHSSELRKMIRPTYSSRIPAYLKETVLCNAMKTNSDLSMWNKTWEFFRNSNYDAEKRDVLSAVGCSRNQTLLKK